MDVLIFENKPVYIDYSEALFTFHKVFIKINLITLKDRR